MYFAESQIVLIFVGYSQSLILGLVLGDQITGVLKGEIFLQNLPSIVTATVLGNGFVLLVVDFISSVSHIIFPLFICKNFLSTVIHNVH
jgi:hypothetical protein